MFFGSEENAATARSHYRLLNPIAAFYVTDWQFSVCPFFSRTFVNHFQVVFGRLFKTRYCVTVYLN